MFTWDVRPGPVCGEASSVAAERGEGLAADLGEGEEQSNKRIKIQAS